MDTARLVLDYVKALIWPGVALTALLVFRQQLRELASRVSRANFLGMEIEAVVRETQTTVEEAVTAGVEPVEAEDSDPAHAWLNPDLPRSASYTYDDAFQAINTLERQVRVLAYEVDKSYVGRATRAAAEALVERGLLQPSFLNSLAELLYMRDEMGERMGPKVAKNVASSALQLALVAQLALNSYRTPRTRVIGDA
ncbi:hypothetical protein ABZ733_08410 [Streptomyces longwoodensis]|uniref:hypothetical protein n=1 Tax=Streptomyces longwoodensis TaxID=68231 RepID=UPI0033E9C863